MKKATNPIADIPKASNRRLAIRLLLLAPWPLLYVAYWSLENVKGPASDGFGMGGYASGIISTAYALSLYALNRAVTYSKRIPAASTEDRIVSTIATVLFIAGTFGLVPMLFFFYLGLPFSSPGLLLTFIALFRWGIRRDEPPKGPVNS